MYSGCSRFVATTFPSALPRKGDVKTSSLGIIAAVPGREWAKKIYPELSVDDAIEKLWENILYCSRVDGASESIHNRHDSFSTLRSHSALSTPVNSERILK